MKHDPPFTDDRDWAEGPLLKAKPGQWVVERTYGDRVRAAQILKVGRKRIYTTTAPRGDKGCAVLRPEEAFGEFSARITTRRWYEEQEERHAVLRYLGSNVTGLATCTLDQLQRIKNIVIER